MTRSSRLFIFIAGLSLSFSAFGENPWLPESSSPHPQPGWREIAHSFFIDLGDDPLAVARLAGAAYIEDVPEVSASKPLACGPGYKKYLVREFFADHATLRVYATPDGLVVHTASLQAPPVAAGAMAICLGAAPGRIEGMYTQIGLPL